VSKSSNVEKKKWIFSGIIAIVLVFSLAISIEIFIYEKNNRSKTHYSIVKANDDSAFRTYRNLTHGERFYYEIFIYGENVTHLSIFLVTAEVYHDAPGTSLFDDWLYYLQNSTFLRYPTNFRTESGEVKIVVDADYLVILINEEDEDLEVEFYYETVKGFYSFSKITNNILLSITALLIPFITIYLAYNEITKKDEKYILIEKNKPTKTEEKNSSP